MLSIFETILQTVDPPRDVPVAVNRGNSGYQKFTDRCDEIVRVVDKITTDKDYGYKELGLKPTIVILYFGDCDPSGENMSIYLSRYLAERKSLEGYNISLERVTVNQDQIVKYNLQFAPQDLDTMQKLWADPNIAKFSRRLRTSPHYAEIIKPRLENNSEYIRLRAQIINHPMTIQQLKRWAGENLKKGLAADPAKYQRIRTEEQRRILYEYDFLVVEIDALAAKMQNIFRNIVLEAADKYFDQDIYDKIISDDIHSKEAMRGLVRSKVVFLEDDPYPTYRPYLEEVEDRIKRELEEYRHEHTEWDRKETERERKHKQQQYEDERKHKRKKSRSKRKHEAK